VTRTCLVLNLLVIGWAAASAARANERRPNFLIVITDDQSPVSLRAYGNAVCQTPHIDRLAREGMVLDDVHHMGSWSGAVCTPSRTMLMTGRTVWRIPGATGPGLVQPPDFRQRAAEQCLPAVFNRAGYDTFRTCKVGNSYDESNEQFRVRREATRREGTAAGGSEWHADQAIEFLDERSAAGDVDPFLLYLGFSHPHDPRYALPELAAKYGASNDGPPVEPNPQAPPLPVNYLPAHPFPHGHPGLRDEEQVDGVLTRRDEATVRNELGRQYACIENIDIQIGRVLAKLEQLGQLDDTYIVFTSDHGIALGSHGLMGKQNLYEHSWRVPLIVRGPGIPAGSRASGYVYLLDLLPTLCDLAGVDTPEAVEGLSFRPVLEGRRQQIRDVLYGVYCGGTKPGMRAVKSDGWKLIEYDVLDGAVRETQLFNLAENPNELLAEHQARDVITWVGATPSAQQIDLAEIDRFAAKRAELETLLTKQMELFGDPYELQ
jgi:choline-sulfatase